MSDTPLDKNEMTPDSTEGVVDGRGVFRRLLAMEGMLSEVYRELGGAERVIREEREGYSR